MVRTFACIKVDNSQKICYCTNYRISHTIKYHLFEFKYAKNATYYLEALIYIIIYFKNMFNG